FGCSLGLCDREVGVIARARRLRVQRIELAVEIALADVLCEGLGAFGPAKQLGLAAGVTRRRECDVEGHAVVTTALCGDLRFVELARAIDRGGSRTRGEHVSQCRRAWLAAGVAHELVGESRLERCIGHVDLEPCCRDPPHLGRHHTYEARRPLRLAYGWI